MSEPVITLSARTKAARESAQDLKATKATPGWVRPHTSGRFLVVDGFRFWVKGVTYGTFRPNEDGEPYPPRQVVREDFNLLS